MQTEPPDLLWAPRDLVAPALVPGSRGGWVSGTTVLAVEFRCSLESPRSLPAFLHVAGSIPKSQMFLVPVPGFQPPCEGTYCKVFRWAEARIGCPPFPGQGG
eukprot:8868686-Prorocentrum_lima.AAC.1